MTTHQLATPIVTRVFDSGLKMSVVLKRAGISRATWWRIKSGKDCRVSSLDAINTAIDEIIKDMTNGEAKE